MYLILNHDNLRLCQDNCWRSFANFGTYPECVKEYRSRVWARRRANRSKGIVIEIPEGVTIDASGSVYDTKGQRFLREFIV